MKRLMTMLLGTMAIAFNIVCVAGDFGKVEARGQSQFGGDCAIRYTYHQERQQILWASFASTGEVSGIYGGYDQQGKLIGKKHIEKDIFYVQTAVTIEDEGFKYFPLSGGEPGENPFVLEIHSGRLYGSPEAPTRIRLTTRSFTMGFYPSGVRKLECFNLESTFTPGT